MQIFGTISSPSICNLVMRRTAKDNADQFAHIADKLTDNFYADNFLDSFDETEEAVKQC